MNEHYSDDEKEGYDSDYFNEVDSEEGKDNDEYNEEEEKT
jgi:hypothetical protein